ADYHTTARSPAEGNHRDPKLTTMEATGAAQKPLGNLQILTGKTTHPP
ncbi:hypothetical protein A2U01_0080464, partial [Trifolium medium]|nr:hypothetical protein [Trifolium medium]